MTDTAAPSLTDLEDRLADAETLIQQARQVMDPGHFTIGTLFDREGWLARASWTFGHRLARRDPWGVTRGRTTFDGTDDCMNLGAARTRIVYEWMAEHGIDGDMLREFTVDRSDPSIVHVAWFTRVTDPDAVDFGMGARDGNDRPIINKRTIHGNRPFPLEAMWAQPEPPVLDATKFAAQADLLKMFNFSAAEIARMKDAKRQTD